MKDIKGYEGLYAITSCGKVWSYYSCGFIAQRLNNNGYLQVQLVKNGKRKNKRVHRLVAEAYIPNINNKPQVSHKDECKTHNWVGNLEWATSKENNNMPLRRKRGSKSHIGELNGFYGKHHSEEAKKKQSDSRKGKYTGEDAPNYGKHLSEETRKKIGDSRRGKYCGSNNPMYGRVGNDNPNSKPVYCYQLDRTFASSTEVERILGISATSITANCRNRRKSAGKHPITGEKLIWKYADGLEE